MIWFVVILGAFILMRFFLALSKDNDDLQGQSVHKKFAVIVHMLNEAAYDGRGMVRTLTKREFNLYEEGENQIIKFQYSTGHLTIIWKYKYFQQEVVHQKQFDNVRNLSIFQQQRIGDLMVSEMEMIVLNHKHRVLTEGM